MANAAGYRAAQGADSDDQTAVSVLATLCENGGKMPMPQLAAAVSGLFGRMGAPKVEKRVEKIVRSMDGVLFAVESDEPGTSVRAYTPVELCAAHCTKAGCQAPICAALHVCKFFIVGSNCKFGQKCAYGHQLNTPRNYGILTANYLGDIEERHIKFLLSMTRTKTTMPRICSFYNTQNGCRSGSEGSKCSCMHVCKHFLQGNCSFGIKCRRSHNIFDPQPKRILASHGINIQRSPKVVLEELRDTYGSTHGSDASSTTSSASGATGDPGDSVSVAGGTPPRKGAPLATHTPDTDSDEICTFALRGKCSYGKTCQRHHAATPYLWQYRTTGATRWYSTDTGNNEQIERRFADANEDGVSTTLELSDGSSLPVRVDFDSMRGSVADGAAEFRRLGTISYVKAAPTHLYTTTWCWYWKDELGAWRKYGKEGAQSARGYGDSAYGQDGFLQRAMSQLGMRTASSDVGVITSDISSREIEEMYVQYDQERPAAIPFQTARHSYTLDLATMTQRNDRYKTERKVRRRPKFKEARRERVDTARSEASSVETGSVASSFVIDMPKNWAWRATDDEDCDYQIIEIKKEGGTLAEYVKIESLFYETMSRSSKPITKISRIQNSELWEKYTRNKAWKEKKYGERQDERLLFHGTNKKYVEAISQQGFDWRIAGSSVGAAYGKGSYFAYTAQLSHVYTQNTNVMFVVKTLVGRTGVGHKTYVKPPPIDPDKPLGRLYDTCVDRVPNPRMVIVFEQDRTYPEYLIEYK